MAAGVFAARKLPQDGPRNGWFETLPARRVEGRVRVDFAVMGAGLCGCSAARRLAGLRPGGSAAFVEAGRVGGGASGRTTIAAMAA